jgi:hypothetical protein
VGAGQRLVTVDQVKSGSTSMGKDDCVNVNSSRRNRKLRAELLPFRLSLSTPAASVPLLDESKVDDEQLSPPRSRRAVPKFHPSSRLAILGHHINELRAKAIIICVENKHRSNSAVSSSLATLLKELVSKLQADRVSPPTQPVIWARSFSSQTAGHLAPSPTTAGCAELQASLP